MDPACCRFSFRQFDRCYQLPQPLFALFFRQNFSRYLFSPDQYYAVPSRQQVELATPKGCAVTTQSRENRLRNKYGELLTVDELAEVLRYSSGASVRKAHAAGRLPVALRKFPNRRGLFATTESVAEALDQMQYMT